LLIPAAKAEEKEREEYSAEFIYPDAVRSETKLLSVEMRNEKRALGVLEGEANYK
jgi:hypothetical protein